VASVVVAVAGIAGVADAAGEAGRVTESSLAPAFTTRP
jgi:hypothetical protein